MKVTINKIKDEDSVRIDINLDNGEKSINKFIDFKEDGDIQAQASIALLKVLFGSLNVTVKNK